MIAITRPSAATPPSRSLDGPGGVVAGMVVLGIQLDGASGASDRGGVVASWATSSACEPGAWVVVDNLGTTSRRFSANLCAVLVLLLLALTSAVEKTERRKTMHKNEDTK
jgi:hypothetical protein